MRALLIAAGGGGDAVGAILASRHLEPSDAGPPLIATYAWERVRVDPEPGPRPPSKFTDLGFVGDRHAEVRLESDTVPPGRSTLPRLAQSTTARLFILDATRGAVGMRVQIVGLIRELDIDRVVVVDVGGDAVAKGAEPELLSPLADALAVAACTGLPVATTVAVIGPGVDGELSESMVMNYLQSLCAVRVGSVASVDVLPIVKVLEWHPTEASGLVAAAALGVRGVVELRRGSISAVLTDRSTEIWQCDIGDVAQHNILVVPLSASTSLDEAETILNRWATSELIRERQRSLQHFSTPKPTTVDTGQLVADIGSYSREAQNRGMDLITVRRLAEAVGRPEIDILQMVEVLRGIRPSAEAGSLWKLSELSCLT